MAKIKSLQGETMTWLSKCGTMIRFNNGYAEVTDKNELAELKQRGYNVGSPMNDVVNKQPKPPTMKNQEKSNDTK